MGLLFVSAWAGGCGHGLFGWDPFAPKRPPDAVVVGVSPSWVERSDVPHVSAFYDALAPHGTWTQDASLGWIWSPSDSGFSPYTDGRWVETEAGPTFLCDAPHGWATAHYGRWLFRDRWHWVPDTRWGPAWVSWRVGGGFVGWAPLGPEAVSSAVPDNAWRFVAFDELLHPQVMARSYPVGDVPWLLTQTRPIDRAAQAEAGGFVVGPEVRFAGWRSNKVSLERLPQSKVRWVPRYERGPALRKIELTGVRAGPASSQRFGRKAIVQHGEHRDGAQKAPKKDPERDLKDRARTPKRPRR